MFFSLITRARADTGAASDNQGHSIPTELEPLQAQMLGGLAVMPCHAGAPELLYWVLGPAPGPLAPPPAPGPQAPAPSRARLWPKDPLSRAPPIPRALLQQCQTLITGPGGPQGVVGQLASGQALVWVPGQEERLLPGPGSQCWLVAGCPGYRRVLCLSHLLEWRGEQWHLASLPQGHCPLQAHSAVWQESRQGLLVALVGRV